MKLLTPRIRTVWPILASAVALAIAGCDETTSTNNTTSSSSASSSSSTTSSSSTGMGGSGGEGTGGSAGNGGNGGMGTGGAGGGTGGAGGAQAMSFFVSSAKSMTANLGGLAGADKKCQDLAAAVGAGGKTWHAYLSVEVGANGQPEHAKDRIGAGPWYNAKLQMVAANLTDLHARFGDHLVFLDEKGETVPGQWPGSPSPNEHDILTGTDRDGMLKVGYTCGDWTSAEAGKTAWVGHSDGLGPMMSMDAMYRPWNSVHDSAGCDNTAPRGGAGRIYCFAID